MIEDEMQPVSSGMSGSARPDPRPDVGAMRAETGGRFREVNITKVENGFIIRVGCKTFVALDWGYACEALSRYWADPIEAEKRYCK